MYCLACQESITSDVTWRNFFLPDRPKPICQNCQDTLVLITKPTCSRCGRDQLNQLDPAHGHYKSNQTGNICTDCQQWQNNPLTKDVLTQNRAVYHYNDALKALIARWKYRGDYQLHQLFEPAFSQTFSENFLQASDQSLLVPIPLSSARLQHRAFNQAEALARLLPYPTANLLTRIEGEKQSKKNRKQRITTSNPFAINQQQFKPANRVILIDDIYTTGATLHHAARLLKQAGVKQINSFTLGR